MERTLTPSVDERSLWPALLVSTGLSLATLMTLGAGLLLGKSELGRAFILLARHALGLMPPLFWLAAAGASALWLMVMGWLWRRPDTMGAELNTAGES
jgi:hypothetical protein